MDDVEFTSSPPLSPPLQRWRRDEVETEETSFDDGDSQASKRRRLDDEPGDDDTRDDDDGEEEEEPRSEVREPLRILLSLQCAD